MSARANSQLEVIFRRGGHPVHLSTTFCLLWIAAADGVIDDQEQRLIAHVGGPSRPRADVTELSRLVRRRDTQSLVAACSVLRRALTEQGRVTFLMLAIELATIDRRLSISENHLCRLFADLLGVTAAGLKQLYRATTGGELPDPGDPSSVSWWQSRVHRREGDRQPGNEREKEQSRHHEFGGTRTHGGPLSRAEAYVVLGLRPNSTPDEIAKAYRRAAQSHHPDRFAELGPEAQRAAHEMFVRIRRAYEVLT